MASHILILICCPLSGWFFSHQWRQPRHVHRPTWSRQVFTETRHWDSSLYQLTIKMVISPSCGTSACLLTDDSEHSEGFPGLGHRQRSTLAPCLPHELGRWASFIHVVADGVTVPYSVDAGIKWEWIFELRCMVPGPRKYPVNCSSSYQIWE